MKSLLCAGLFLTNVTHLIRRAEEENLPTAHKYRIKQYNTIIAKSCVDVQPGDYQKVCSVLCYVNLNDRNVFVKRSITQME